MQITIVNTEVSTPAGKKFQMCEVVYKSEYQGKVDVKTKKLMSFVNPSVFATAKDAKQGEVYEVVNVKEGEYYQWTSMTKADGSSASAAQGATSGAVIGGTANRQAASYSGRDFESKDERAERQRLIVRQSAVNYAIAMLSPGAKTALDKAAVFALAESVIAFVTQAPSLIDMPNADLDIPY